MTKVHIMFGDGIFAINGNVRFHVDNFLQIRVPWWFIEIELNDYYYHDEFYFYLYPDKIFIRRYGYRLKFESEFELKTPSYRIAVFKD